MKFLTATLIVLTLLSCSTPPQTYQESIQQFQYKLNTQFADRNESPLTNEDFKTFKSLDFFNIDENYKVNASISLTPNAPIFEMPTTTERAPLYKKYGIAKFELNGTTLELSIYQNHDLNLTSNNNNYLFLPFNDKTNGTSSYSGGRYIDLEIPKNNNNKIIIDFNKSYNPYCAYNHKYSCPIPPSENILPIEILAGVKDFHKPQNK